MQPLSVTADSLSAVTVPMLQLPAFLVWIIVGIGFCIFIFQTIVIAYHWYMYAPSVGLRRRFLIVHGIVSAALLFFTLAGAFIVTLTR